MSIDVAFQPKGPTVIVDNSAGMQVIPPGTGVGMVSFRITNLAAAAQRLGWGVSAAKTSAAAPGGVGVTNAAFSLLVGTGLTITLELPASTFFIATNAAATGFEITPGQGATGT